MLRNILFWLTVFLSPMAFSAGDAVRLSVFPVPQPPQSKWLYKNGMIQLGKRAPIQIGNEGVTILTTREQPIRLLVNTWYPRKIELHHSCKNLKTSSHQYQQLTFTLEQDYLIHCLFAGYDD